MRQLLPRIIIFYRMFQENSEEESIALLLNYTSPTNNPPKYILVSSYGLIKYAGAIKTSNGLCRMSIPLEQLPEGICALTVLNAAFEPLCERLFYANKKERIKIEIAADKANYQARDKVVLSVKATKADGSPAQADLSLAVTDKQQTIKDGNTRGISAYKLLESELKGNIEDADFYFRGDSVNSQPLDLLLLTQGFRRFLPHETKNNQPPNPDRYFSITGKIEFTGIRIRKKIYDYKTVNLTLMSWNSNNRIYQTKPDSLGRFSFQLPLFLGNSDMFLQATNARKKQFNGEIILDEVIETPWQMPLSSQCPHRFTNMILANIMVRAIRKLICARLFRRPSLWCRTCARATWWCSNPHPRREPRLTCWCRSWKSRGSGPGWTFTWPIRLSVCCRGRSCVNWSRMRG